MNQSERINSVAEPTGKSLRESVAQSQAYRNSIGIFGEKFVMEQERIKLKGTPFAKAVVDFSDDPDFHFDILSFSIFGEPIYVEVKTTASTDPYTVFYMSQKEIDAAWESWVRDETYEIHRVYGITSAKPGRLIFSAEWLFREYCLKPQTYAVYPKAAA